MTIYDEDGDGVITKDELLKFALAKAKAEDRQDQSAQIIDVVNRIVLFIDKNNDGKLTKDELVEAINRDPYLKKIL
jgi:Ca2+-binding EF-hand superfamily protein